MVETPKRIVFADDKMTTADDLTQTERRTETKTSMISRGTGGALQSSSYTGTEPSSGKKPGATVPRRQPVATP
jgi:hypothetical protein